MDQDNATPEKPALAGHITLLFPTAGIWLAVTAALLLVMAGLGTRFGLWPFRTGFTILGYGGWCGLLAALVSLPGIIISIRGRRVLGFALAGTALVAGIATFAVPFSWKLAAGRLPRIHDITTDVANPPRFVAVIPLRKDAVNPVEYGGTGIAVQQLRAYPGIKTLVLELPQEQAFALALDAAQRMGWAIDASVPLEGRIEATDSTFWFGFKDDIVIRISGAGSRSLVDIRSVSRVGISDVGTNARRVRAFLKNLEGKT